MSRGRHIASSSFGAADGLAWQITVVVWAVVLPALVPLPRSDRGIVVSVAERLLAGDRLYSGVWDNQDPLFYYSISLGRWVDPIADVALEIGWLALAAAATTSIARHVGAGRGAAVLIGMASTPLVVAGTFYRPGTTQLPGTALLLAAVAAGSGRRWWLAGVVTAVLAATTMIMAPLALVVLGVLVVADKDRLRSAGRLLVGLAVTAWVLSGLLEWRGELQPYLDTLSANVTASGSDLLLDPDLPAWRAHLHRVFPHVPVLPGIAGAALFVIAVAIVVHRGAHRRVRAIAGGALACTVLAAGILLFTGLFQDQAQILYPGVILALAASGGWLASTIRLPLLAGLIPLLLAGGIFAQNPAEAVEEYANLRAQLHTLREPSRQTRAVLSVGSTGSYARVGTNDDDGHAYGLRNWNLVCPRFHQYYFDPAEAFEELAACLPNAEVILVEHERDAVTPATPQRRAFLDALGTILDQGYTCTAWRTTDICQRR